MLVAVAVVGGLVIDRAVNMAAHSMTFDTGVPTRFSPQPMAFCNGLHQGGGLQQMVDSAGIGSTGTASAENTNLLMLRVVVTASPDLSTRMAMVGLYRDVLTGDSQSSAANSAISAVEEMHSCARYP